MILVTETLFREAGILDVIHTWENGKYMGAICTQETIIVGENNIMFGTACHRLIKGSMLGQFALGYARLEADRRTQPGTGEEVA